MPIVTRGVWQWVYECRSCNNIFRLNTDLCPKCGELNTFQKIVARCIYTSVPQVILGEKWEKKEEK